MFFYDKVKFSLPHVQIFLYKMMPNQSLVGAQKVGYITIKEETFIDRHFPIPQNFSDVVSQNWASAKVYVGESYLNWFSQNFISSKFKNWSSTEVNVREIITIISNFLSFIIL